MSSNYLHASDCSWLRPQSDYSICWYILVDLTPPDSCLFPFPVSRFLIEISSLASQLSQEIPLWCARSVSTFEELSERFCLSQSLEKAQNFYLQKGERFLIMPISRDSSLSIVEALSYCFGQVMRKESPSKCPHFPHQVSSIVKALALTDFR